jgi:hypothetical protein
MEESLLLMVGGVTPSEVEEKVARIDDAICAEELLRTVE